MYWDTTIRRYRSAIGNHIVAHATIRRELEKFLAIVETDARGLAAKLVKGEIELADWQREMRDLLKASHTLAGAIGRGGREQMSKSDWGRVGGVSKKQYNFLERFATAIEQGTVTPSQIEYRAALYIKAARTTFYDGELESEKAGGRTMCRRRQRAKESCPECVEWAKKGWIEIEKMPRIGSLVCKQYCACFLEYK